MGNQRDAVDWLANRETVMRNLGAVTMALDAVSKGKKMIFKYKSPSFSKTYGCHSIIELWNDRANLAGSTGADREFKSLMLVQNDILRLYNGLLMAQTLYHNGQSFITTFKSNKRRGNNMRVVSKRSYSAPAVISSLSDPF